jgi:hypothetical protein
VEWNWGFERRGQDILLCENLSLTFGYANTTIFYISENLSQCHWITERLRWSRGSVLAFGTQVRGFKPGRNRRIFLAKKSSALLPSEGK